MSGYKGALAVAVPLDARGDVTGKTLWELDKGTPYVPSPLLVGGRLWFTQMNEPVLTSVEAKTGKVLIDRVRLKALRSLYASPAAAAGRIYLSDRDGTTIVFKQADKFEVLAVNRLDDSIDASPAIAGTQLFLRGQRHLYCIEEK
jgi:outer membrane protein assembly factor BamB